MALLNLTSAVCIDCEVLVVIDGVKSVAKRVVDVDVWSGVVCWYC